MCIVLVLYICWSCFVEYSAIKYETKLFDESIQTIEILSENQKVTLENFIEDKLNILKSLATYPDIYNMNISKINSFLKGRSHIIGFTQFFVMNMDGLSYYVEEEIYRDQQTEIFFSDVMRNDIFLTRPFFTLDHTIITLCKSLYDDQGKKTGVLCGTIDVSDIQKILEKNNKISNGESFLLDSNGVYILAKDMELVYNQVSLYESENSDFSLIQESFADKKSQSGTIIWNGNKYQASISYINNLNCAIITCFPIKEIQRGITYLKVMKYVDIIFFLIIVLCIFRIIIAWKKSDQKINIDPLTKCSSRAAYISLLERLKNENNNDIAIIYLDLNDFKVINDTYGHDIGDNMICIFSEVLLDVFEKDGFVGRVGGDEFVVILLNIVEEEIELLWKQVEYKLKKRSQLLNFSYTISSSYGYAIRHKNSCEDLESIVKKADENMYKYKTKMKESEKTSDIT